MDILLVFICLFIFSAVIIVFWTDTRHRNEVLLNYATLLDFKIINRNYATGVTNGFKSKLLYLADSGEYPNDSLMMKIYCHTSAKIVFEIRSDINWMLKVKNLVKEANSLHKDFDQQIFIGCNDKSFPDKFLNSEDRREAIKAILRQGAKRIEFSKKLLKITWTPYYRLLCAPASIELLRANILKITENLP